MKRKIVAIIQARLTSKRFPNKVIKKIGNLTVIEIILERLKKSKVIDDTSKENIFTFCPSCGFNNSKQFAFCPKCGQDLKSS